MARFDGKTNKQIASKLKIGELSGVDKPAHAGAAVTLFKCQTDVVKMSFDQAMDELSLEDDLHEAMNGLFTRESALHRSISSILNNSEEYPNPKESIAETLRSYALAVSQVIANSNLGGSNEIPDGQELTQAIEESYKMYKNKDDVPFIATDLKNTGVASNTTKQESNMTLEQLQAENTSLKSQLATALKVGALTASQKAAYLGMSQEDQESFLNKSHVERDTVVDTIKAADPVVYTAADGTEFRKSDGALVGMAKRVDEQERIAKQAKDELSNVNLAKRAEVELSNMPGSIEERTALIKAVDAIEDEVLRNGVMESLKSKNLKMAESFKTKGTARGNLTDTVKSAEEKLDELARQRATKNDISYAEAYSDVLATSEGEAIYAKMVG